MKVCIHSSKVGWLVHKEYSPRFAICSVSLFSITTNEDLACSWIFVGHTLASNSPTQVKVRQRRQSFVEQISPMIFITLHLKHPFVCPSCKDFLVFYSRKDIQHCGTGLRILLPAFFHQAPQRQCQISSFSKVLRWSLELPLNHDKVWYSHPITL